VQLARNPLDARSERANQPAPATMSYFAEVVSTRIV
jgi:hypothetical protein